MLVDLFIAIVFFGFGLWVGIAFNTKIEADLEELAGKATKKVAEEEAKIKNIKL